ncbi:MAG: aquaporin [Alphaproteobacteria bacterium]|nr:aquaporin [Alphaproteobacteria bacterium]MCL2504838.1 aquaporin [Alphaproteobacteria bacterium]
MKKQLLSEFLGTFVLVLFGCGAAIIAGEYIGYLGIAAAFGLAVLAMIYAVGPISGGHFNPAVTVGQAIAGCFKWKDVGPYVSAQVSGAAVAAAVIYAIVLGGSNDVGGFAANVVHSDYSTYAAFLTEFILTFVFLIVILGVTSKNAETKFAGLAIGLALTAIHLVSIPVTNTSVNPARSISQALFSQDPAAVSQLWLFIAAPILGALAAGFAWKYLMDSKK